LPQIPLGRGRAYSAHNPNLRTWVTGEKKCKRTEGEKETARLSEITQELGNKEAANGDEKGKGFSPLYPTQFFTNVYKNCSRRNVKKFQGQGHGQCQGQRPVHSQILRLQ